MGHEIHAVECYDKVGTFTLNVRFADGTSQVIDFEPALHGELFGPLGDVALFDRVRLDPEARTLAWPNGADFDAALLHDWPTRGPELAALARTWATLASAPASLLPGHRASSAPARSSALRARSRCAEARANRSAQESARPDRSIKEGSAALARFAWASGE